MANLIIKPTSGGSLVLQDEGGDAALTVGTTGVSTITNATITAGTFPAGHIIQVKHHTIATMSGKTSSLAWPTTAVGFSSAIQSSSDVLIHFSGTFTQNDSNANSYVDCYFNGGGVGSTDSGFYWGDALMYKQDQTNARQHASAIGIDTAPGSTTPTYQLYFTIAGSLTLTMTKGQLLLQEIAT